MSNFANIDPENERQIERLAEIILRRDVHNGRPCYSTACHVGLLAESLAEYANPPKLEEPKGLGAVVEDKRGERYVVDFVGPNSGQPRWYGPTRGSTEVYHRPVWSEIEAVKVLSEGVTQ